MRKVYPPRKCEGCPETFTPVTYHQKFHSAECRWRQNAIDERNRKRELRGSIKTGGVNLGGLVNLFQEQGPITFSVKGETYQFRKIEQSS